MQRSVCSEPTLAHGVTPCTEGFHLHALQSPCPKFMTLPVFSGSPDWNNTFQLPFDPQKTSQGVIQRSWWDSAVTTVVNDDEGRGPLHSPYFKCRGC